MLEILKMSQDNTEYLEKDDKGLTLVSDKVHPININNFVNAYSGEKCYFKGKNMQNMRVIPATSQQIDSCSKVMTAFLAHSSECPASMCPGVLAFLSEIFEVQFIFQKELVFIIQMDKIYPILLASIRQCIKEGPIYFTTKPVGYFGNETQYMRYL